MLILIGIGFMVSGCSERRYTMSSASMEPTIPEGATVIVDEAVYENAAVERKDIICYRPNVNPKWTFVFRVAGLPNEMITLRGDTIYADGQPTEIIGISRDSSMTLTVKLKDDEYFVIGDNTAEAVDSRYDGPIHKSQIIGKVIKINAPDDL
ncbi:signal peptidase I [bacterium]|nr:signal peptidase I [bacterium]